MHTTAAIRVTGGGLTIQGQYVDQCDLFTNKNNLVVPPEFTDVIDCHMESSGCELFAVASNRPVTVILNDREFETSGHEPLLFIKNPWNTPPFAGLLTSFGIRNDSEAEAVVKVILAGNHEVVTTDVPEEVVAPAEPRSEPEPEEAA